MLAFFAVQRVEASTFVLMDETALAARSVAAVRGTVTEITAGVEPDRQGVQTFVRITPREVVFGSLPAGDIVLRETGGRVAGLSEWVFGSPEYQVGEEVLVFLSADADGALHTTGLAMGKFSLSQDTGGRVRAVRRLGEGVAVWDPLTGTFNDAPEDEEYELNALQHQMRAAAARLTTKTRRTAPVRNVPAGMTRLSLREQHASFTYLSTPSRWFEPDTAEPISYLIDATGDVGLGAATSRAAMNDAFAAWTNAPGSDLALVDGGTLDEPMTFAGCTGGNRIVFNDPFNEVADPSNCSGVIAIGGFCASSETRVVNGTSFRRIRVGKVTFNNGWTKCAGWNRCNVAEVATHELGHTLGFGHATDFTATMYASAHFDGRCASLRADDLNALTFVYPAVGGASATPTPTFTPLPSSPTATVTRTRTATATVSTATRTPTRTATRSATPSRTPTRTATRTWTSTRTSSPTVSWTATAGVPPTGTATPRRVKVRGHVRYYSGGQGVPGVTMTLRGASVAAMSTGFTGEYEFTTVPVGSTYEVGASKAQDFGNAVSPLDAAYVLQHVARLRTLSPDQQLACDVTGDGTLSTLDAARLLEFSVGAIRHLPLAALCQGDWLFVPDPDSAPAVQPLAIAPHIGAGQCEMGRIMIEELETEADAQDFRAMLLGDCTGNWSMPSGGALQARSRNRAPVVRLGRLAVRNGVARLPVYVRDADGFSALDLHIQYADADLQPTGAKLRRPADGVIVTTHTPEPGTLRVALASGEPLGHRAGALLTVEFAVTDKPARGAVRLDGAVVDEEPATIRRGVR